jgi:hypothetical protein
MFGAANGDGAMIMRGGEASTLTLVMTNLDLARAASLLLQGDQTSQIHCAITSFGVANGQVVPQLFVVDTTAVTIKGEGSIDFSDEKYDLHLKAQSKKPSILALRGPIVIGGTFKTPAVHPEMFQVGARIGAAAGLAAITPPLALLALVDFGGAPDVDCRALMTEAGLQKGPRNDKSEKNPRGDDRSASNAPPVVR